MGSSDSLTFPSEPPDIGNWFSSYAYQSPELNTIEDFKDSSDSVVAETEESPSECKQDLDRNVILARSDDLLLEGKRTSDDVLNCKNPTRDGHFASKVLEYSDSFSLGSEPPEVKTWFSSYVYESPELDTSYEFRSNHKEDEAYDQENDAKSGSQEKEVTLSNSMRTGKDDFEGENIPSFVEFVDFKDKENEDRYIPEDSLKANGNLNSAKLNDLMTQWSSDQNLEDQGNGSAKDFVIAESSPDKLSRDLNPEISHVLLDIKSGTGKNRGKPAHESILTRDLREESSKAEDFTNASDILVSADNIEFDQVDEKPVMKKTGGVDKENSTEFAENGFISTRKSKSKRLLDKENSFKRPFDVKSGPLKNGVIISPCCSEEAITRIEVLSEVTNFQTSNAIEVTGKWKCPQKSKPNVGPPLKQLRLEQFVRRM